MSNRRGYNLRQHQFFYAQNEHNRYYTKYKCNCSAHCKINIVGFTFKIESGLINISICGSGFKSAKEISINDQIITVFTIVNDTRITVSIPYTTQTSLSISVSNNNCTSNVLTNPVNGSGGGSGNTPVITNPNSSTSSPVINSISPPGGSMGPLINITIFGTGLTTLQSISSNGIVLSITNYPISIISDTMVSFILPFVNPPTDVPIFVTTTYGVSNTVYYHGVVAPMI